MDISITKTHDGDIVVEPGNHLIVTGIISGDVQVDNQASADINGIVNGNITINPSGAVTINGTVNGNIHNLGGATHINGIVGSVSGEAIILSLIHI